MTSIFLVGCSSKSDKAKFTVIASNFPGYDFARAVIKDVEESEVKMLLSPGGEMHDFEPTPQDIINIKNSDVFIYVGGESDEWIDDVINDIISLDEDISYIDDRLDNELSYINSYISELNNKVDDIVIPSYNAGEGINIDEHNKISVDITPFVDDSEQPTIYLNERGQLVVNKEVVLSNAESNFVFINERGEWVGDMANVKNYIDTQDS